MARDYRSVTGREGEQRENALQNLNVAVNWPTPVVTDSVGAGNRNLAGSKAHAGNSLTDVVRGGQAPRWTTPQAQDSIQHTCPPASRDRDLLAVEVVRWPTAGANDWKGSAKVGQRRGQLDEAVEQKVEHAKTGSLNPDWVELLMGWPAGWSGLEPLEHLDWPAVHGAWPAPPGPQHDWEPPRVAVGVKDRVKRLKALGNGQVPQTAALAWEVLG